jgi:hypothetical protein
MDNPYRIGFDAWMALSWIRGFLAGRTPDPNCPRCHGSGRLVVEAKGPEEYGIDLPCYCNRPALDGEEVAAVNQPGD